MDAPKGYRDCAQRQKNGIMGAMKQDELFKAETQWFHVFKAMIDSGDVAKMGPHAATIYLVIKAHANFATGFAFPSLETISEKSGISLAQVKRELKTLEEHGYISKEKRGRNNIYRLREKIDITDESGRPAAVASWDYLPASVSAAVADLRRVLVEGDFGGARLVNIEQLTLNIHTGSGPQLNINLDTIKDKNLREQIEKLIHSSQRASSE